MYNWETYHAPVTSRTNELQARIVASRQRLVINDAAFEALGRPAAVRLLFDRETATIGVRPVGDSIHDASTVTRERQANAHSIAVRGFFKRFNLPLDRKLVFPNPTLTPDGTLTLSLHQAMGSEK